MEGKFYVLGTVIDTENSSLGGAYYVEDAKDTGVWEFSLDTYEKKKISSVLYNDIYIYNKKCYGVSSKEPITVLT